MCSNPFRLTPMPPASASICPGRFCDRFTVTFATIQPFRGSRSSSTSPVRAHTRTMPADQTHMERIRLLPIDDHVVEHPGVTSSLRHLVLVSLEHRADQLTAGMDAGFHEQLLEDCFHRTLGRPQLTRNF